MPANTKSRALKSQPQKAQCLYCSLEFYPDLLSQHQEAMHPAERPDTRDLLTADQANAPPGTVIRRGGTGDSPGIPIKARWNRQLLELACECPGCGNVVKGKWDSTDEMTRKVLPPAKCPGCGDGPMSWMFPTVDFEPPTNEIITYEGVSYYVLGERVNKVPSVIKGLYDQSVRESRRPWEPKQDSDFQRMQGRPLAMKGLLPPIEDEE